MKLRFQTIFLALFLCLTILTVTLVGCRQKEDLTYHIDTSSSLPVSEPPTTSTSETLPLPENIEEAVITSPVEEGTEKEIPKVDTTPPVDTAQKEPQNALPELTPPPVTEEVLPDKESPCPNLPSTPTETPDIPSEKPISPSEEKDGVASSMHAYEQEVARLVNEIRQQHGLSPLRMNTELCAVAREKSDDMRRNGYFDHVSPTYGSPFDMMKAFGISYRAAGENIAMGYPTPAAVVEGWMNSEGHRANILNSSFTEIGVGYVADGHYWTQMFIG